jgi:hypothetical protein
MIKQVKGGRAPEMDAMDKTLRLRSTVTLLFAEWYISSLNFVGFDE